MKKFELVEHTADAKFLAYGATLEEAFSNAAIALFSIMTDVEKIKPKIKKHIVITSSGAQALLYDFLEELIFILDTEKSQDSKPYAGSRCIWRQCRQL